MEFEFGILGELALSGDEHPASRIAARAYELELQKQKKTSFAECEGDLAQHLKHLLGDIVWELQPSEDDKAVRLEVISRLSTLLNSSDILRGATISPFGSFESDFYTQWADLDLSLELPKGSELPETIGKSQKVKVLKSFMRILIKEAEPHNVQFIPYARVPLLTFEDSRFNISCDISVDNGVAILKSRILRWISNMDTRCRDLIILVKCWAKAHCINDPKTGTLNSFALCLLVIFHLQTRSPPVLPPLNAVLHEDIARKFSGRSQISREQLLNSCAEKIQSFITNKYGAQNKSSVAELFVSFFCQFSSVSGLWLEGLAACTFTGTWGDMTSTSRQWRSKHYVMAVEDPFDRLENCARSVQEYSFPGIIHAFSSTAEAFKYPPLHLGSQSLLELLFCRPEGAQKLGIRMWLSKVYSREGKVTQEQFPKRFPAEGSASVKVVSCKSHRPVQTMDDHPRRNEIVHDRGTNFINQCQLKIDPATTSANPYSSDLENHFGDQSGEQLIVSKGKSRQRVRSRKSKGFQVDGKVLKPIVSETSLSGALHQDRKGELSSTNNVISAELEFPIQGATCRSLGKSLSNAQCPLERNSRTPLSVFSETNKAGTEIMSKLVQRQPDADVIHTKNQSLSKTYKSRWRRSNLRREGATSQEIIAPSLPDIHIHGHQTCELPSDRMDMRTFKPDDGTRQGNTRRQSKKSSNVLCLEDNTRTYFSEGPETKKVEKEIPSKRKDGVSKNLAPVNAEDGFKGLGKTAVQKGWEKPAEELFRAKKWTQTMAQNGERKPFVFDEEDSLHILTGTSGHTTLVEGLESMRVSDVQSRHQGKFFRAKTSGNKGFEEQFWRPKCQD